jgi:phage-related tail protein
MVERRRKSAVISGAQNKAQFRIKLINDIDAEEDAMNIAQTKLDRMRESQSSSELDMEVLEHQIQKSQMKLASLHEEMRLIDEHVAKAVKAYKAADKFSNVNNRFKISFVIAH